MNDCFSTAQVIETDQSKKYALTQQCIEETGGLGVDCILDDGGKYFILNSSMQTFRSMTQMKISGTRPQSHLKF